MAFVLRWERAIGCSGADHVRWRCAVCAAAQPWRDPPACSSIALESVLLGMGLSFAAMAFAAAGLLYPVAGAILQEVIDVAVILNALRALADRRGKASREPFEIGFSQQCRAEH